MTMGVERCMVDTNVLVYSTVDSSPHHQEARHWMATLQHQGFTLCIYQVHGKQVHDANIVATMLAHGVSHLLEL